MVGARYVPCPAVCDRALGPVLVEYQFYAYWRLSRDLMLISAKAVPHEGLSLTWRDREKPTSKDIVRQTCKSRKDEPAGIRLLKVETPNLDNDAQTDCLSICSKADTRITRKTG